MTAPKKNTTAFFEQLANQTHYDHKAQNLIHEQSEEIQQALKNNTPKVIKSNYPNTDYLANGTMGPELEK